MKTLAAWFHNHNLSTHGLALAIGTLAILVETDTRIRDMLIKDLDIHPKIISSLACLGAILLAYKQPKKMEDQEKSAPGAQTPRAGGV